MTQGYHMRPKGRGTDPLAIRGRPGIIEVVLEYNEGDLVVGDDVMVVLVAGDIRENVFPGLVDAVNLFKARPRIRKRRSPWSNARLEGLRMKGTGHEQRSGS
jgi:molybdopterin synthase catalytic subunit